MSEINIKSIEDQIKEESDAQLATLNNYVDHLLEKTPDPTDALKAVASQMKADRTAQEAADIAKAQEDAKERVKAEYKAKYGDSDSELDDAYRSLLNGLTH